MPLVPREEWPDPDGEKPADWLDWVWEAFRLMRIDGVSMRDAAFAQGRVPGTLSNQIRKMRERYGAEFWPATRKKGWPSASQRYGAQVRLERASWPEARALAGLKFGAAADVAREAVVVALEEMLKNPERLATLTPKDILDLAKVAEVLAERADVLNGIVPMTRGVPIDTGDNFGRNVDLGALAGAGLPVASGSYTNVIEMAQVVVEKYRASRAEQESQGTLSA